MSNLLKRLSSSAVFISLAVYAMFFAPLWLFLLVVEGFALTGFYEFLGLAEKKGIRVNRPVALALAALIPIAACCQAEPVILVLGVLVGFILHFKKELKEQAFLAIPMTVFGLVYVVWFFSHLVKMKFLAHGSWWIFYTMLMVKAGDAAAYFVGSSMGRVKLAEHISPKKSVEGAWGQMVATIALSLGYKIFLHDVPMVHLFILGALVAVVAQAGDLFESLMKRDVGIKDSGSVPGLGGILDILDSVLLTAPLVYYYAVIFLHAASRA